MVAEIKKLMTDLQLIQSKIFELRGQRVMLDRDLAAMYGGSCLRSQFVTLNNGRRLIINKI